MLYAVRLLHTAALSALNTFRAQVCYYSEMYHVDVESTKCCGLQNFICHCSVSVCQSKIIIECIIL